MPVSDALWMSNGKCHPKQEIETGADWFADAGTIECVLAVTICKQCDVSEECLQHAIATDEMFGVWGGLTPAQRYALTRGASREQALRIRRTHPRLHHYQITTVRTALLPGS